MASSGASTDASAQAASVEELLVTELPKFDLDLYIQNYTGRTRLDRLLLIGKSCVPLRLDALKAAITEAKSGRDVSQYKQAWDCIRKLAPEEPEATRDEAWIDATEKSNKAETQRLESELKGYKNNLIKESIRMGNEDLGRHFEAIGKLNDASDAYSRIRQDVSSTKHIIDCDEEQSLQTFVRVMSGIAHLSLGNYLESARNLLLIDFAVPPAQYSHVASPNDIAVYGGLTALATMDRAELQRRVLDNQSFRTFLEHEPHIRKAVSLFKHVRELYTRIRTKCIVQYFVPFSRITLESLEAAFGLPGQSLQDELMDMIRNDFLNARIDARNQLLVAVQQDPRADMQKRTLDTAKKYESEATEHLRRVSIISAGLEVVPGRTDTTGPPGQWYEEPRQPAMMESRENGGGDIEVA
ncbi:hypothetical protein LMH87_003491 [Akanthomyces muscarius]|uniref:PCI domain-containing protein n=1 Tax=Akanthomyces muscarius TaxID=2231603 RepID=A0A9W8UG68_AKAMU|nr:hypothetical protein LMH87_003491 [Akanthomyces muscarius]KAJ4144616.1 hypothetical protein LMH87_003491 [Akanthomyces muscarius]